MPILLDFVPNSTVDTRAVPPALETCAFEFGITMAVPWVLRAVSGGSVTRMVERGIVDTGARKLTLVCIYASPSVLYTQTVVYSAIPAGSSRPEGCRFAKHIEVDLYSSILPKWAVDAFWKLNDSGSKQSRLDHDVLAQRLEQDGVGQVVENLARRVCLMADRDATVAAQRSLAMREAMPSASTTFGELSPCDSMYQVTVIEPLADTIALKVEQECMEVLTELAAAAHSLYALSLEAYIG